MGSDKAKLRFGGVTLLEHAIGLLRDAGFTVAVAGLRSSTECSAPVVNDEFAECGPLGGIEAALRSLAAEPSQPVLFVPVDLPLLPADLLRLLFERAQRTGAWATVPFLAGSPQPLSAVYDSRLAAGVRQALTMGDRKIMRVMRELAPAHQFDSVRVEALVTVAALSEKKDEQARLWFANVNTPADWQAIQASPLQKGGDRTVTSDI